MRQWIGLVSFILAIIGCPISLNASRTATTTTRAGHHNVNSAEKLVNPYKFKFIIEASPCSANDELLIVVHTSPKSRYSNRRMLMRKTWLDSKKLSKQTGLTVKIVYFCGTTNNSKDQRRIEYESELYRDITQSDFIDDYVNNTYKVMSYLLWTSQKCNDAKLLMKIDDDTLIKTPKMADFTSLLHELVHKRRPVYAGRSLGNYRKPVRVQVGPFAQWYISREVWAPNEFPLWFQGLVYFLSPQYTRQLFNTALTTHYMHTDDVFVGILVHKTKEFSRGSLCSLKGLSSSEDMPNNLEKDWVKSVAILYHVPDMKSFYSWYLQENIDWFSFFYTGS